ncbi:MAG: class I SAM-dependent methyltransferase [Ferrovum myxofaciens]|uniref:class I SAM-dependent methyltransferase n=1 Tax=Ferrovum myxofaciens TaxID=416213 RepID=UPI0023535068|nr:class I SAM-dependent methyltransferase [Ferrovum myxofaciens]QKE41292.1 MAG: class I SAM-dependent methyltransferase [Ferrovum myxofaciens]
MNKFQSYVRNGKNNIEGWFSRVDSQIFYELLSYQNLNDIEGGVAEIGMHHGKSFIALCLGMTENQKAYGVDIFENQQKNLDRSGSGVRDIVENNLKAYGIDLSRVIIDPRGSDEVNPEDIYQSVGCIRFFSVDGGHWRDIVCNDLSLAASVLVKDGVIALDDFLRPEWPDVSAGFFEWFEKSNKSIVPLAIGHNKLYLCHKESIYHLQKILIDSLFLKHFFNKYYMFLGNNIPIFQSYHLPEWNMRRRVYEYLKIHHPEFYVKFRGLTGS